MRARRLSNAIDILFAGLHRMPRLSNEMIRERIRGHFQTILNKSQELAYDLPVDSMIDISREVELPKQEAEKLRQQLTAQFFGPATKLTAVSILAGTDPTASNSQSARALTKDRPGFSKQAFEVSGAVMVVVVQLQGCSDHLFAL